MVDVDSSLNWKPTNFDPMKYNWSPQHNILRAPFAFQKCVPKIKMVRFDIPFEGPITNGLKLPLIDFFDLFSLKCNWRSYYVPYFFLHDVLGGCFEQWNAHFNKHFVFQNIIHFTHNAWKKSKQVFTFSKTHGFNILPYVSYLVKK